MAEPAQRLFLALWPEAAVREQLAGAVAALAPIDGRRIPPENLHVTLAFLGGVTASRRQAIEQALTGVVAAPFEICFDEVSWRRRNRIVWLSAPQTPAALLDLVAAVRQALLGANVPLEERPYRPHVTLARDVARGPNRRAITPICWSVREMCLVASRLTPRGSHYTIERCWPLAGVDRG